MLEEEGSTTLTSLVLVTTVRPGFSSKPSGSTGGGASVGGGAGVGAAVWLKKILITSCRFSVATGDARETSSAGPGIEGMAGAADVAGGEGCLTDTDVTTASTTSGRCGGAWYSARRGPTRGCITSTSSALEERPTTNA